MGERSGTGRKCAGQGRFFVDRDIRRPFLPFVCFVISRSSHFSHGSTVISRFVKVIHYCTRSLYSFLFSDILCLSSLFILINVLCRSVTKDWIHCAQPSRQLIVQSFSPCPISHNGSSTKEQSGLYLVWAISSIPAALKASTDLLSRCPRHLSQALGQERLSFGKGH